MNKKDTDIIDDIVRPIMGSVKTVRIDGFLDRKYFWNGGKWVNACRNFNCKKETSVEGLCKYHYNQHVARNISGETKQKGGKTYKWDGKKWKMLCDIQFCKKVVSSMKTGKCLHHSKNPDVKFSGAQNTINIYNQLKEQAEIDRKKKLIETKRLTRERKQRVEREKKKKEKDIRENQERLKNIKENEKK